MNAVLEYVDWMLMALKAIMLVVFILLAKDSLKSLVFNTPSNDDRTKFEHSFFILFVTVLLFQFLERISVEAIVNSDMGVQARRQLFYVFLGISESLLLIFIIKWHTYKKCEMARVTVYTFYVTGLMIALVLLRYVDRVVFETNYLDNIYSHLVVFKNIFIDILLYSYPLFRLSQMIRNRKFT